MAKKGAMPTYATIDDYIVAQPEHVRSHLHDLRRIILEAAPDAEEKLNYKVPTFALVPEGKRDYQLMMAGYDKFIGFYPFPTTMDHFASELSGFKQGKGSVQFPLNEPLPEDLIRRMVAFRRAEILDSSGV
ncbi:DUF1801 domain-containing protein [Cryomorphaceae bacterium]|nr:DUF1801 domain-containing protein [Cryomorphaceae bacterium]